MPLLPPPSVEIIHWTSSFLQPLTDSEGREIAPFYTTLWCQSQYPSLIANHVVYIVFGVFVK